MATLCDTGRLHRGPAKGNEALVQRGSLGSTNFHVKCAAGRLLPGCEVAEGWHFRLMVGQSFARCLYIYAVGLAAAAQQSKRAPFSTKSLQSPPLRTLNIGLTLKEKH